MSLDIRCTTIERLGSHPGELRSFMDGLTEEQLREHPASGKWSLHELILHICEGQDVFIERVARILTEENPQIELYEPDDARRNGLYLAEDLDVRMKEFEVRRETLVALLQTLTESQWKRTGSHPEMKNYSVERAMEGLMRHEEHHLYQMFNVFFAK